MNNKDCYNCYAKRDPICVSHYPNPSIEPIAEEIPNIIGLKSSPQNNNSAAIYVHVPFCAQICVFCPFNKVLYEPKDVEKYVDLLKKEIDIYSSTPYMQDSQFRSIYFGGGTPSVLKAEHIAEILEKITKKYKIMPDAQISFEGSPSTLTYEKLQALRENRVNRISIGVQTFNTEKANHLRLYHTPEKAVEVIRNAFKVGFDNVGIDLMYNLPGQSLVEWLDDVQKAVELKIRHITLFSLCVVPGTLLEQMLKSGQIPPIGDEDNEIDYYIAATKLLKEAGYVQYSVWDFALPGYIDEHVVMYYTKQRDLVAHGPAAFGNINRYMYINCGQLERYFERVENGLLPIAIGQKADEKEAINGMMAKGLRMISVKRADFRELFHSEPEEYFADKINELQARGLLEVTEDEIRLSELGIIWGNNVCKEFFSKANQQSFENRVHLAKGQKANDKG
jgi:putative oxygen-independent coproporphyrinogen III oxidase